MRKLEAGIRGTFGVVERRSVQSPEVRAEALSMTEFYAAAMFLHFRSLPFWGARTNCSAPGLRRTLSRLKGL